MFMYSPILRNRQSERLAFKHVKKASRQHLIPLFDVAAPTKTIDQADGQKFVERNIARTGSIVGDLNAVFVDSSELDPAFRLSDGTHPLVGASDAIAKGGARPIPVTGLHRDADHNAAALAVRKKQEQMEICIRLDATDVSTATLTNKGIQNLLTADSIAPAQVYLLLDMQSLYDADKDAVIKQIKRLLELLKTSTWAGIIVGGYGIPDQLTLAVPTKDRRYLPRIEQDIFYGVVDYEIDTRIWFADYTILPPSVVELDWKLISKVMTPKAVYTLEDSWFVVRGSAFSSHPDGYDQYYAIADEIVALDEYCGKDYSYGDKYIWDRSQRVGTAGSPGSWITACANHHITFTASAHAT